LQSYHNATVQQKIYSASHHYYQIILILLKNKKKLHHTRCIFASLYPEVTAKCIHLHQ